MQFRKAAKHDVQLSSDHAPVRSARLAPFRPVPHAGATRQRDATCAYRLCTKLIVQRQRHTTASTLVEGLNPTEPS